MGDFKTSFAVLVYTYSLNSIGTAPAKGQAYFFGSVAFLIVVIGLLKFIGWIATFYIYTDVILDCIINKLQCSM